MTSSTKSNAFFYSHAVIKHSEIMYSLYVVQTTVYNYKDMVYSKCSTLIIKDALIQILIKVL